MNKLILGVLFLGVTVSGSAGVITSYTNPTGANGHNGAGYGQSLTTPAGGPWDTIGFNLIDDTGAAYAIGGLYVLNEAYAGTRADLSSSTAGYLGFTNTISNGIWDFSGVTLNPGTQYFFYMDSIVPLGPVIELVTSDVYPGGNAYADGGSSSFQSFSTVRLTVRLVGKSGQQRTRAGYAGAHGGRGRHTGPVPAPQNLAARLPVSDGHARIAQ